MLTVITPATVMDLTTVAAVKAELAVSGSGDDAWLADTITRASATVRRWWYGEDNAMPYAAPRICKCGSIIPAGQPCPRCSRESRLRSEAGRPTRHERGYDDAWMRLRNAFIKQNPACIVCGSTERCDVDHKISIRERPDLRLEWSNLQTLCRTHHNRKTHGK